MTVGIEPTSRSLVGWLVPRSISPKQHPELGGMGWGKGRTGRRGVEVSSLCRVALAQSGLAGAARV